jgi:hypothetical protein
MTGIVSNPVAFDLSPLFCYNLARRRYGEIGERIIESNKHPVGHRRAKAGAFGLATSPDGPGASRLRASD